VSCSLSVGIPQVHLSGSNVLLTGSRAVRRQFMSFLFEPTISLAGKCKYVDCSKYVHSFSNELVTSSPTVHGFVKNAHVHFSRAKCMRVLCI